MEYLIYATLFALSLFLGALTTAVIFRRHLKKSFIHSQELASTLVQKADEIKEQRAALQEMIYQFHHYGLNPKCKRLRGISDLGLRPIKVLRQNLELLSRPHHHKYAKMAIKEVDEIEIWWTKSIQVCLEIEKEVIDSANKFNHLQ